MHLIKFTREVWFMDNYKKVDNDVNHTDANEDRKTLDAADHHLDDRQAFVPDHRRDEETASEITDFDDKIIDRDNDVDVGNQVGNIPGWIGLALAVLSFFMMPIILGGAAIIVGFIARRRDATWLGNTAITLGVISIIVRLFFIPFA